MKNVSLMNYLNGQYVWNYRKQYCKCLRLSLKSWALLIKKWRKVVWSTTDVLPAKVKTVAWCDALLCIAAGHSLVLYFYASRALKITMLLLFFSLTLRPFRSQVTVPSNESRKSRSDLTICTIYILRNLVTIEQSRQRMLISVMCEIFSKCYVLYTFCFSF